MSDTLKTVRQPIKPHCDKCNNTGLIPFIKNGNTIPNAFVYCECYQETEHYNPVSPEDIDFPVSYSFYRSLCQQHGWTDPGSDMPHIDVPKETKQPEPEGEWTRRQWDVIRQLEAEVRGWRQKHAEMMLKMDRLEARNNEPF